MGKLMSKARGKLLFVLVGRWNSQLTDPSEDGSLATLECARGLPHQSQQRCHWIPPVIPLLQRCGKPIEASSLEVAHCLFNGHTDTLSYSAKMCANNLHA